MKKSGFINTGLALALAGLCNTAAAKAACDDGHESKKDADPDLRIVLRFDPGATQLTPQQETMIDSFVETSATMTECCDTVIVDVTSYEAPSETAAETAFMRSKRIVTEILKARINQPVSSGVEAMPDKELPPRAVVQMICR